MNIVVVGLGLIGGSFCKAIKRKTDHTVFGIDIDEQTIKKAVLQGAIDKQIEPDQLCCADITIVCLYPEQTIDFIKNNKNNFKPGSIVIDACGVKQAITQPATDILKTNNVHFVGCHPMSGREFSGFDAALSDLFEGSYFIITPIEQTNKDAIKIIALFAQNLGFGEIIYSSPQEHDKIISFTSQLAHIVSNAYMKSPTALTEYGFTGGSFQDLTRVALLNQDMWAPLFLLNKKNLMFEIDKLIFSLQQYRQALDQDDIDRLKALLKEGSDLKLKDLKKHNGNTF